MVTSIKACVCFLPGAPYSWFQAYILNLAYITTHARPCSSQCWLKSESAARQWITLNLSSSPVPMWFLARKSFLLLGQIWTQDTPPDEIPHVPGLHRADHHTSGESKGQQCHHDGQSLHSVRPHYLPHCLLSFSWSHGRSCVYHGVHVVHRMPLLLSVMLLKSPARVSLFSSSDIQVSMLRLMHTWMLSSLNDLGAFTPAAPALTPSPSYLGSCFSSWLPWDALPQEHVCSPSSYNHVSVQEGRFHELHLMSSSGCHESLMCSGSHVMLYNPVSSSTLPPPSPCREDLTVLPEIHILHPRAALILP